jgi:hypothetical protein
MASVNGVEIAYETFGDSASPIGHPERVLSLTSIMSTTGDRAVGQPHPEAIPALLTRPPQDRDGFIDFAVGAWRVIGSPGFEADEGALRARAGAS